MNNNLNAQYQGPEYYKALMDALNGKDELTIRDIISQVGGYVLSRVKNDFDKLGLMEALSDTDNPEAEVKKIHALLGLDYGSDTGRYALKDVNRLFDPEAN